MLLSANVGLLAISSVDGVHGDNSRNLAQVASYASVLMSLGSYLTGHILSLQHTEKTRDPGEAVSRGSSDRNILLNTSFVDRY